MRNNEIIVYALDATGNPINLVQQNTIQRHLQDKSLINIALKVEPVVLVDVTVRVYAEISNLEFPDKIARNIFKNLQSYIKPDGSIRKEIRIKEVEFHVRKTESVLSVLSAAIALSELEDANQPSVDFASRNVTLGALAILEGNCEFSLEETETANVTYLFEIFKTWSVTRYFLTNVAEEGREWLGAAVKGDDGRWTDSARSPQELRRVDSVDRKKLVEFRAIVPRISETAVLPFGELFPVGITSGNQLEVSLYRLRQENASRGDIPLILQAADVRVGRNTEIDARNVQGALEEIGREFLKCDRNLTDVEDKKVARRNLGLGSIATRRADDYAFVEHGHGGVQISFEFLPPGIGEASIGNIPSGVLEGEPNWIVVRGSNEKYYAVPCWQLMDGFDSFNSPVADDPWTPSSP